MINPDKITNFNRSDRELEEFMIFAICAAGKNANTTAKILNPFFDFCERAFSRPIRHLASKGDLPDYLKSKGIGCYNNRAETIYQLYKKIRANKDFLKTATVADLEAIYGIGPKTARFFIMHSRQNQRVAALDTHILKELKANGIEVPKSTPPAGKRYNELEKEFIKLADKEGMHVADYDLMVWKKHRKKAFDKASV